GGGGVGELGTQARVFERRGQHFQRLVAGSERPADGGGGGGERGDAGDDGDRRPSGNAGDEIHGRAIEQRIALAEPGDVAAAGEPGEDLRRGGIVGRLGRAALDRHRDGGGQQLGIRIE